MKNRAAWRPVCITVDAIERPILKKGCGLRREPSKQAQGRADRGTESELDRIRKPVVSLTGWLCPQYAGPPETTKLRESGVHDWHLEISKTPAITRRKSAIRHQIFARSRHGLNNASTSTGYASNRLLDFSGYRT